MRVDCLLVIHETLSIDLLANIAFLGGAHQISLILPLLFIEMKVPSYKSERSCVLGVSILSMFLRF